MLMALVDVNTLHGTHDLRLPAWGPYTKRYMGFSHIPDIKSGLRFDLSVFPGLYRRNVNIPNVMWESGYHPWLAAADFSFVSHRHEVVGKDQVYTDIDFCRLDDQSVLVRAHSVNQTDEPQNLVLHYMASLHFPPLRIYSPERIQPDRVDLPEGAVWVDALSYSDLRRARFDPRANLSEDGHIYGEVRDHGFVDGQGLGRGFGQNEGDTVTYEVAVGRPIAGAQLLLRYRLAQGARVRLRFGGLSSAEQTLDGDGDFTVLQLPVGDLPSGVARMTITSLGGAATEIDGFVLASAGSAAQARFLPVLWNPTPQRLPGPRPDTLILKYDDVEDCYGLAWGAQPFDVREFLCDELDSFMRLKVHEHVQTTLRGQGDGHYTNIFMRPLFIAARSERVIYGLVCNGERQQVGRCLAAFDPTSPELEAVHAAARRRALTLPASPAGERYRFSQERMAATLLTNVVYPVRTRGTWIRHHCPGRWWDCLYTWDSGFIGLGLLELDVQRAIDCLNAYMTEPGERDAAFIHHGSPVPVQFPLFLELWNRTQDRDLLAHFYPRLQQYHRFLAGRLGSSTTRTLGSNLLRTWDYFYNSGGWDDYPPQKQVHARGLEASVTPVINSAQAILTAQILHMMARALGEPVDEYDRDVAMFSQALQRHSWDQASGYFGYVRHDDEGKPAGILRHESGANYNMGLDGAYPLIAGVCTAEQELRLLGSLMSGRHMWCRCGISTVDQSAPYYRDDGYWNGAVWMPHQWYVWKALLDLGKADEAYRIARTALDVWRAEVESSYNCFEHFLVQSGRGAGWHHFGGLSAPVLSWYGAYHRPGRLTTGLHAWVEALAVAADHTALTARLELHGQARHTPVVIAALAGGRRYLATWNGQPVPFQERYPGILEIALPAGDGAGELVVQGAATERR